MFNLHKDEKRNEILQADNHLLVMGGPGSGKTTVALFKAKQIIENTSLINGQKVLFLSFARATIARVEEQAGDLISTSTKRQLEINTYHGFIWNMLKHHGYLISENPIKLLPPHEASSYLLGAERADIINRLEELFHTEGLLHFDLFAKLCKQLLLHSCALREIVGLMYPTIILDEFQDTNEDEWGFICALGSRCRLIALADPDQRIYDFRGADPHRISQFIDAYSPNVYDFGNENNRSNGTDITQFGNDLLAKLNKGKNYHNVDIKYYRFKKGVPHIHVKIALLEAIERLKQSKVKDWSIAVLIPTNALMIEVSDMLQKQQTFSKGGVLPPLSHEIAIESAGPTLAALFIATILEIGGADDCSSNNILTPLVEHILGRRGTKPAPKKDAEFATAIREYISAGKIQGKNRKSLIAECEALVNTIKNSSFTGNIILDWKMVISLISKCKSPYLLQIVNDSRYIRALQRGTQLYSSLDGTWRKSGCYKGATQAVSDALTQEHFAMSTKKWGGINVMTIHKAKGKEFDEVIIYEGRFQNRIVSKPDRIEQARLNLRVAVTRAKRHTLILTPNDDPCPLL